MKNYVALLLMIFSPYCFAQNSSVPLMRDPGALALLQKSINAMDGTPAAPPIVDFTISGTVTVPKSMIAVPRRFSVQGRVPHAMRMDLESSDGVQSTLVCKGTVRARKSGSNDVVIGSNALVLETFGLPSITISRIITHSRSEYSLTGSTVVDGIPVYKLHLVPHASGRGRQMVEHRTGIDVYIEQQTNLVRSIVFPFFLPHGGQFGTEELHYSNYITIQGHLVPSSIVEVWHGQALRAYTVNQLILNPGLAKGACEQ